MIDADDISFFKKAVEFSFESRKRLFPAEIIRKNDFYSLKKRNGENRSVFVRYEFYTSSSERIAAISLAVTPISNRYRSQFCISVPSP